MAATRGAWMWLGTVLLMLATVACASRPPAGSYSPDEPSDGGFHFVDVSLQAGLTQVVWSGRPGKDHLLDSAGTGLAWLDFDRDGWLDLYVASGWKLGEKEVVKARNTLYRNRGDGSFEDVTSMVGVEGKGEWGSGVAVADYDGDGWTDILVTSFGPNILYRNRGDGTFEDVSARAGIEAPGWNTGAAFFDADADGDLDLYIAAYIDCSIDDVLDAERTLDWKGVDLVASGPSGLAGAADHFFINEGKGKFRDATREAGLSDDGLEFGFGVRALDVDNDGDQDLYVANDSGPNHLYLNDGKGKFVSSGLWSGAAFDSRGAAQAGMGVAAGDVTGDGEMDLVVTNFSEDFTTLYRGDGAGYFEDVSEQSEVGSASFLPLSWGVVLSDLDNDTDFDIVVANGHIYPQVDDHPGFGMTFGQTNQLLANDGSGRFVDESVQAGPGFAQALSSRGLAAADYDNDGDVDLVFTHLDAPPPSLLRNDTRGGDWLGVICEVPPGAGSAVGARVIVEIEGKRLVRDVSSSGSYLSVNDPRAHFGLGSAQRVDSVEVIWSDGTRSRLNDVSAGGYVTVRKGD